LNDSRETWDEDAECAKFENRDKINIFFSNKNNDKFQAKLMCSSCPVRKECVKDALESKRLYGVWGGLDDREIKRTLSVNWEGQEMRRKRFPKCAFCSAKTLDLVTKTVKRPNGGRWATMRVVECTECGFEWQSRTSANAVDAYHAQRAERMVRADKDRAKKKALKKKEGSKAVSQKQQDDTTQS
jgi:WhiB family redox-sensing transcriptional regulator